MVKSYKPIPLDLNQALKAVDSRKEIEGFQSVLYGVEGRFIPSENKALNKRYICKLYKAGGYLKSINHFIDEEKSLYFEPTKLIHNPQFVHLLKEWDRNDLAYAIKNRQRITGLKQAITNKNQKRLLEVFKLLYPAELRQQDQYRKSALGAKSAKKSKEITHQEVIKRTKARAKSLLAKHDKREIASIIANEEGVTSRTIRDRLKK